MNWANRLVAALMAATAFSGTKTAHATTPEPLSQMAIGIERGSAEEVLRELFSLRNPNRVLDVNLDRFITTNDEGGQTCFGVNNQQGVPASNGICDANAVNIKDYSNEIPLSASEKITFQNHNCLESADSL